MVINVTVKSFEEAIADFKVATREAIHEYQMGCLMDKYTFLQENGVVMEEAEAEEASKGRLKTLIGKFISIIQKVWATVTKKISDWYNTVAGKISNAKQKAAAKKKADDTKQKADKVFDKFEQEIVKIKNEDEGKNLTEEAMNELARYVDALNESYKAMGLR